MWKFVDLHSILHVQRQLVFHYSPGTRSWIMDEVSRYMVAESLPQPINSRTIQKAVKSLELECCLWAYGRHPEREGRVGSVELPHRTSALRTLGAADNYPQGLSVSRAGAGRLGLTAPSQA